MEFRLWSELNQEILPSLKPDIGLRDWSELTFKDKQSIWNHLEMHFFDFKKAYDYNRKFTEYSNENHLYHPFFEPNSDVKRENVNYAITTLYRLYKIKAYTQNYIKEKNQFNICEDFYQIFINQEVNVVMELLSLYCLNLSETIKQSFFYISPSVSDSDERTKLRKTWELDQFNLFASDLNEVFSDFGLNVHLTPNGFIPKQDKKIVEEIFTPVLNVLSDEKWREVNKLLFEAFSEFRENSPQGYSGCVTHTVSAIQAFLQILVYGKTGTGDISKLIVQAQKEKLIPNDMFTKEIFKTVESVMMRERQTTGDAHPKKDYASEKNAKLILNIAMIFIQHCLV